VVVGSLLRLRFLFLPLNTDEAGFAEVARLWSRGYPLYGRQAWVDRPQGLLLLYRLVAASEWDPTARVLALVAGAVATVAVGAAAWALAGRRAAVIAAVGFAVLSPAPHLEGFTANGELLATAFTSAAVASAAWWWARGRKDGWLLLLAGVLAGIGPLVKQSAFDALVAIALLVVLDGLRARRSRSIADLGIFLAGAAAPLAVAVVHAATIGFGDWWFAMIGHRAQTDSLIHGRFADRVSLFRDSLGPFWRDLGVLVALAMVGVVGAHRRKRLTLPLAWLLAAAAGFAVGGLYHPHYWVQLAAPLVLLAALGLDSVARSSTGLAVGLGAAALVVPLAFASPVYVASTNARASGLTTRDARVLSARAIGNYIRTISRPDDEMAVLWTNAALYWEADRAPAFQYMWWRPLSQIRGAAAAARATITGPHPPAVVVVVTNIAELDRSGAVSRTLDERYQLAQIVDGVPVYRLRGSLPPVRPAE
jgi:4-amino-4-deoxy-L-arabinose transferase-like glycosyltransferase